MRLFCIVFAALVFLPNNIVYGEQASSDSVLIKLEVGAEGKKKYFWATKVNGKWPGLGKKDSFELPDGEVTFTLQYAEPSILSTKSGANFKIAFMTEPGNTYAISPIISDDKRKWTVTITDTATGNLIPHYKPSK